MGILGNVSDGVTGAIDNTIAQFKSPFAKPAQPFGPDFAGGFVITEYIDGVEGETLTLAGNRLPMVPFTFGGEQKIVKDYYPGNAEPVVQVLGSREDNTVIKGRFKAKQFSNDGGKKEGSLYGAPEAFQRQMDAFRVRGNLCLFSLGEWHRWGYLEKTKFEMAKLSWIDYELTLSIVGFNRPTNAKFVTQAKEIPLSINKDLILQASFIQEAATPPMPQGLAAFINSFVSDVAKDIALVTNFVDNVLKTKEDLVGALNRALGLVKNARTSISIFQRRLRAVNLSFASLGTSASGSVKSLTQIKAEKHANAQNNASFILTNMSNSAKVAATLAKMQSQFEALILSTPQARYLVKAGDTLQQISIKYFGTADHWKDIYDHNKMLTTGLVTGTIIEIPRLKDVPTSLIGGA